MKPIFPYPFWRLNKFYMFDLPEILRLIFTTKWRQTHLNLIKKCDKYMKYGGMDMIPNPIMCKTEFEISKHQLMKLSEENLKDLNFGYYNND